MREIKFRAYYKADKRIYEVLYLDFASNELRLWDEETELDFECSFEDVELMQYTDLKDKNSKEIYEGDVVSFKSAHSDYDYKTIGEVVWYCGEAAFLVECDGEIFKHFDEIREIEVLGNIYESPEFLQ